ncbi:hypothetical protein ABZ671_01915 [Micromonospora sp. NPDC006766]|uniref:hypothetical protein n=1 Tax=Micromonospora sp. NPDC006766 TaxID=3154778 RepID=UPI0033DCAC45
MLPVAFTPPLWATTLRTVRDLMRVAVAALVLVVGLNGLATAPATAPAPVEATVFSASTATGASAVEVRVAAPDGQATAGQSRRVPAVPAPGVPSRHLDHDVAPPPAGAVVVPAADPDRESIARRGPPRA